MNRPSIYLGNIPYDATKEDIKEFLEGAAPITVYDVRIVLDDSGKHRGFGFASVDNQEEVKKAIEMIDGATFMGRRIVINEAHAKQGGGGQRSGGAGKDKKPRRGNNRRRDSDDNDFWTR